MRKSVYLMVSILSLAVTMAKAEAETGSVVPAGPAPAMILDAVNPSPAADQQPSPPAESGGMVIELTGDSAPQAEAVQENPQATGSEGMIMESGGDAESGVIMEETEESSAGYIMEEAEEAAETAEDVIVEDGSEAPKQE
jgi:hypothetical protein